MHKDVTLASRIAGAHLAPMPILGDTLGAFAESEGWSGEDFSGVAHVVEKRFRRKISRS